MANWGFLTNHARVLLCIAHDPGVRLRDIAASVGITERSAYGIVTDLTEGGYVVKRKDGRRNRYLIQAHLPLPEPASGEPAIGEVLALLSGAYRAGEGAGSGRPGSGRAGSGRAGSGRPGSGRAGSGRAGSDARPRAGEA